MLILYKYFFVFLLKISIFNNNINNINNNNNNNNNNKNIWRTEAIIN